MNDTTNPRVTATVTGATATLIGLDGRARSIAAAPDEDIRHLVVEHATEQACRGETSLELITSGDRGEHHLLVTSGGEVTPITDALPSEASNSPSQQGEEVKEEVQGLAAPGREATPEPPTRASFISAPAPVRSGGGWLAMLARGGLAPTPSQREIDRKAREAAVSRHWAGCRPIAVVNGKGGVGKTMTTAMIAAVLARHGGGNVLAWDNNDTRGTLGWRTEQGTYEATVRDLLRGSEDLLAATASVSDISRFVHHQTVDRCDVLRSNPELLAADQRLTESEFDLLMRVAARYYRLVIFDSGNDESADRWLRMVDHSLQLVIPTLTTSESAESAALLLDALRERDDRSADLAAGAVVVVTQAERTGPREHARIVDSFAGRVRAVESVPFDPALKSGPLKYDSLHAGTQDAWLRVAAAVVQEL